MEGGFDGGYASGLAADGLPVVAPLASRVARVLEGADPRVSLGRVPPCDGEATLERVAACAVMAGCESTAQLEVIVAAMRAVLRPEFNAHGGGATTMGCTPLVIVSGRARRAAGINCGAGTLGSGTRGNACVGRAVKLCLAHIGGAKLGGTESTTIGTPGKYVACFGENEEALVGTSWAASTKASVTVAPATGFAQVVDFDTTDGAMVKEAIAKTLTHCCWGARFPMASSAVVVLSPEHFKTVSQCYETKATFQHALWHACNSACAMHVGATALASLAPRLRRVLPSIAFAALAWLLSCLCFVAAALGRPVLPKFESPEAIRVVVAGGPAGKFTMCVSGFGAGLPGTATSRLSVPTSAPVEALPRGDQTFIAREGLVDPRPPKPADRARPPAKPLAKVGLLDISKGGSADFLDALEGALLRNVPIARYRKPTFARRAPADLLSKILADGCSHVVLGLAD